MTEVEVYRMSLTRYPLLYISIPWNQKTAPIFIRAVLLGSSNLFYGTPKRSCVSSPMLLYQGNQ